MWWMALIDMAKNKAGENQRRSAVDSSAYGGSEQSAQSGPTTATPATTADTPIGGEEHGETMTEATPASAQPSTPTTADSEVNAGSEQGGESSGGGGGGMAAFEKVKGMMQQGAADKAARDKNKPQWGAY